MKRRCAFSLLHPTVTLLYLTAAIAMSMSSMRPYFVACSFLCGSVVAVFLAGARKYFRLMAFVGPVFAVIAAANPLFSGKGLSLLFYVGDVPVTVESIAYGLCTGGVFAAVMVWFFVFDKLMTNEKFLFLFGRLLPSAALMTSMALKLIPQTLDRARVINDAFSGLYGPGKKTVRFELKKYSVLMGWMMEDSFDTALSMRARGYGRKKRTLFSTFVFGGADAAALAALAALTAAAVYAMLHCTMTFYPYIDAAPIRWLLKPVYPLLLLMPVITELMGEVRWKLSR